ncbi:hypothetical protein [Parasphingorhabdus sp.]|uniref:hypothetical protein n=1 Tax=Parasphingorhabdus sp. TaxID=2709688 RepID=UPI003267925D
MSDDKKTDKQSATNETSKDGESGKWSTGAKVGAAIGSAAVAAALIYAGRHKIKKHNEFKPAKDKPQPKYENEPDYDEDEDLDGAQ